MPHINIYVSKEIEKKLRKEAKRRSKSLSAIVVELVSQRMERGSWQKGFFEEVVGGWKGDFPVIERPLAEKVEGF